MKRARQIAIVVVIVLYGACLAASWLAPSGYAHQFRDDADARPSFRFPLGTDELGRDRFARLLYGGRVSLLLAPAAALIATFIAALLGALPGYVGGWMETVAKALTDVSLSLPWLFLLITVRALLPLNVEPLTSSIVTFLLLGILGWAGSGRVLLSGARALRRSDFVLQARASGVHPGRLFFVHVLPNLRPVLSAQFWISIPVFVLAEANLSILGLGVAEPLPSLGSLLRDLGTFADVAAQPWRLAPILLLVTLVGTLQLVNRAEGNVA